MHKPFVYNNIRRGVPWITLSIHLVYAKLPLRVSWQTVHKWTLNRRTIENGASQCQKTKEKLELPIRILQLSIEASLYLRQKILMYILCFTIWYTRIGKA